MQQLRIDNDFKNLIPPQTDEERAALEASIIAEGCRDPLDVWNGVIVDGHHRYEICTRLGVTYTTREREFESREAAMLWMIRNQFARRNLSAYVRSQLAARMRPLIEEQAKENQRLGGKGSQKSANLKIDTRKEIANAAGVSHDTIHKVETVEAKAPEPIKAKARTGDISPNRAYKLTKALENAPAAA